MESLPANGNRTRSYTISPSPPMGGRSCRCRTSNAARLGIGNWQGKVFVLGGMDEKANVSMEVFVFDPSTGKWGNGPKLPGAGMAGFGVSAWNVDGHLFECGVRGVLYSLMTPGQDGRIEDMRETPQFFHRLVPAPGGGLIVVGGASTSGHLASIERVEK